MFHHYPFPPMDLLVATNPLNNVLPEQLLNLCLAHECLTSFKGFLAGGKAFLQNASIAGELILGFAVLSLPLPYLPLLTLPSASRRKKNNLWKGETIFFGPIRTKLTTSPYHLAFSADHNSRAKELCASSLKLRQPQGFLGLLLYTNHTSL